ncbi:hypothetical protein BC833DRAFT_228301 [Globomyces pollinis-pini]|nr:hypothetical protein BC833DRAFT_228301 [Globomyces pollinis-pini]
MRIFYRTYTTAKSLIYGFDHSNHINHSIKNTGLFGYDGLDKPQGLIKAAAACIQQATFIVEQVCNADSPDELRKTIKRTDTISDILCSVLDSAEFIRNVHPDSQFVDAANTVSQALNTFLSQLNTHQGLFKALHKTINHPEISKDLSEQERKVATLLLLDFEKSGIDMPLEQRKRFIELNDMILKAGQTFCENSLPSQKIVSFEDPYRTLEGTPSPILDALCRATKSNITKSRKNMKAVIPTQSEIAQIIMGSAKSELARRDLFLAINSGSREQVQVLEEMLIKRGELASLLGKKSYAHMYLADKMVETPENVETFLSTLATANRPYADEQLQLLKNAKRQKFGSDTINAWDRFYFTQYIAPMIEMNVKPFTKLHTPPLSEYFSVGTTFQGLSDIFKALYGMHLQLEDTIPGETWHSDVRKLSVVHETEGVIGTIYCDLFNRESNQIRKYENAAHFTVRCSRRIDNDEPIVHEQNWRMKNPKSEKVVTSSDGKKMCYQLPIVVLVTSFNRPEKGIPSLLSLHDIETLFHEMGHAMHSMLAQTDFQHISGTRVAIDFVEVPSIFMEYFAKSPEVLQSFGRHYKTNETVPLSLIQSSQNKQALLEALDSQNQIQMAMLDQKYHSDLANSPNFDTSNILYDISSRVNPIPVCAPSKWQIQFTHLFTYGASYYSYLWCRRWASRLYRQNFENRNMESWRLGGENLRHEVLGFGGGRDPWIGLTKLGVVYEGERDGKLISDHKDLS